MDTEVSRTEFSNEILLDVNTKELFSLNDLILINNDKERSLFFEIQSK